MAQFRYFVKSLSKMFLASNFFMHIFEMSVTYMYEYKDLKDPEKIKEELIHKVFNISHYFYMCSG